MATETSSIYVPEMTWEVDPTFPGTAEVKILRDDGPGKARTAVVRLPAGGRIPSHVHISTVQHYILEGEYEVDGAVYRTGTYRRLASQAELPEIVTHSGVTVLMIYDPNI